MSERTEPEMEDKAITSARRWGFAGGIAWVACCAVVLGVLTTYPKTTGYLPADISLGVALVVLFGLVIILPVDALTGHAK